MSDPQTLPQRYVAAWNDGDPVRRTTAVRELWAVGGSQLLAARF